ncbi:hypothetical protein [uncultured Sphingomonas sp.]|uniref:hypothetical protein n=1 Tax=uncultured Sphingomonas sp. TaxID=158754 RepID=UPI0030FB5764
MPTGYTAAIVDGTVADLRSFALQCARGMGATITMRDDPWDKPIPERFEPSTYYRDRLEEAQADLLALRTMAPAQWQEEADAAYAADAKARDDYLASKVESRARYDAMIAQVEQWQGAPEGLKPFMLDQLRSGRDFDCSGTSYWKEVEHLSGEEWKMQREEELMRSSARAAEEWQKEQDRTAGRNAWIAQLRASLDAYEAPDQSGAA